MYSRNKCPPFFHRRNPVIKTKYVSLYTKMKLASAVSSQSAIVIAWRVAAMVTIAFHCVANSLAFSSRPRHTSTDRRSFSSRKIRREIREVSIPGRFWSGWNEEERRGEKRATERRSMGRLRSEEGERTREKDRWVWEKWRVWYPIPLLASTTGVTAGTNRGCARDGRSKTRDRERKRERRGGGEGVRQEGRRGFYRNYMMGREAIIGMMDGPGAPL